MTPHDAPSPDVRHAWRLRAGRTVVDFLWSGDRWAHRIHVGGDFPAADTAGWRRGEAGGDTIGQAACDSTWDATGDVVWDSLEGPGPPAADPRWPTAPVLVELSRIVTAAAAERSPLVGVGLAGRSHFSASIAPDPRTDDTVRFEIACRLHEPPVWLGSTYRVGGRTVRLSAPIDAAPLPRTVVWSYSIGPRGIGGISGATLTDGPA